MIVFGARLMVQALISLIRTSDRPQHVTQLTQTERCHTECVLIFG